MSTGALKVSLALWERRLHYRTQRAAIARMSNDKAAEAKWTGLEREARVMVTRRKKQLAPPMPTGLSASGLRFIQNYEGWSSHPYDDGVGVKTIGFGFTAADFPNGRVPSHMTRADGDRKLADIIAHRYAPPVLKAIAHLHPTQNMADACISFAYNLGTGAFTGAPGFDTFQAALRSGDKRRIADAMLLYSNPGDPSVHAGLLRRRQAERALFLR